MEPFSGGTCPSRSRREVGGCPDELPEGYPEDWHTHWSPLPDPRLMTISDGGKIRECEW